MFKHFGLLSSIITAFTLSLCFNTMAFAAQTHVILSTTQGDIELRLEDEKAPFSTLNFLQYVKEGFYTDTIFHRIIPGFMVQGGGMTADMQPKMTRGAITNEANNGLKNIRGSVAFARTAEKDSATSQFFINVVNNDFLNHSSRDYGYAVFAHVIKGMEVVDKMASVATGTMGPYQDVPKTPIKILKATIIK